MSFSESMHDRHGVGYNWRDARPAHQAEHAPRPEPEPPATPAEHVQDWPDDDPPPVLTLGPYHDEHEAQRRAYHHALFEWYDRQGARNRARMAELMTGIRPGHLQPIAQ